MYIQCICEAFTKQICTLFQWLGYSKYKIVLFIDILFMSYKLILDIFSPHVYYVTNLT